MAITYELDANQLCQAQNKHRSHITCWRNEYITLLNVYSREYNKIIVW